MTIETEDNVADDLRAAFEEVEKVEEGQESASTERARGEDGKFVASDEVKAAAKLQPESEPAQAAAEPAQQPSMLSTDKPPSSWTPAAREKWGSLDPDIRQEIIRREEASMVGVRQIQERFAPAEGFLRAMDPIVQEAKQLGASPQDYIYALAQSERTLRTADVQVKFQEILRIADQYGVPLRDVINKSVGQEVIKAPKQQQMQIPPEFQQELQAMRQWRQEVEQQQAVQTVEGFGQDKEFFNDVRHVMADLVERGMANDLNDAYDKACWMHPGVRSYLLNKQASTAAAGKVQQRQQAAAGASIAPAGKVQVDISEEDTDDIASVVRNQFNKSVSGRV